MFKKKSTVSFKSSPPVPPEYEIINFVIIAPFNKFVVGSYCCEVDGAIWNNYSPGAVHVTLHLQVLTRTEYYGAVEPYGVVEVWRII